MQEETPKSEDSVVADHVPTWTGRVNSIENMNYNDLSSADKDVMYQMSKDHIGSKYGDLIEVDRINNIPNHIKSLILMNVVRRMKLRAVNIVIIRLVSTIQEQMKYMLMPRVIGT